VNLRLAPAGLALLLALPFAAALAAPQEKARDEVLVLFGQRRVTLAVPAGFMFSSDKDERGLITARLGDPQEKISLQISFLPDTAGEFATPRGRKEFLVQTFQRYVAGSVEQAMQFEELEPRAGAGTYCIFTDQDLVGKTSFPPGEYLHATTGLKTWRGCLAVFTLMSNSTSSDEYRAAMRLLRDSLVEPPLTPLR
jgi:hypothetical protein